MNKSTQQTTPTMGFLTVVEHPQHGLFGGYLLLNTTGRPLEFHCTAPIKANRAQKILYGPTLESFLYGEQIGRTLLEQTKIRPAVVWTDRRAALAVREHVALPVALVLEADPRSTENDQLPETANRPVGEPSACGNASCDAKLVYFQLGTNRLAVPATATEDHRQITQAMADLIDTFDLGEPFGRIREAIEEAQQAVRAA